jgi:lipid-A-disaccharide synthase
VSTGTGGRGTTAGEVGPRFVLVAGEASGDALGAGLVEALRQRFPNARFAGIGGDAMRSAGMETWHDASELSVMGLFEVLRHLPRLLRLRREFRERALAWQPDVLIGIDAPDFNLAVERWFKQRGVATVHYVSPSVWAWREKRAEKIGASADRVLCLFPMEPAIYARHGVDARWACHPGRRCWRCCRAVAWARSSGWARCSSKRPGTCPKPCRPCTWWCRRPMPVAAP